MLVYPSARLRYKIFNTQLKSLICLCLITRSPPFPPFLIDVTILPNVVFTV